MFLPDLYELKRALQWYIMCHVCARDLYKITLIEIQICYLGILENIERFILMRQTTTQIYKRKPINEINSSEAKIAFLIMTKQCFSEVAKMLHDVTREAKDYAYRPRKGINLWTVISSIDCFVGRNNVRNFRTTKPLWLTTIC